MRTILHLIRTEAWFLKKTILVIGVILIAFVAALLSVISVYLDVPDGMYEGVNEYSKINTLTVMNSAVKPLAGGTPFGGRINGITRYTVLTGSKSYETNPHNPTKDENEDEDEKADVAVAITLSGFAVLPSRAEETFALYDYETPKANFTFPKNPGELVINKDVAKLAGVQIGDTITLSPDSFFNSEEMDLSKVKAQTYTVIGYVDTMRISNLNAKNTGSVYLPSCHFYFCPEEGTVFDELLYYFNDAKALHARYLDILHSGKEAKMASLVAEKVEDIAIAQAFFLAVTFVLGLMVLFILYSLIAIFYRQRKKMICRLKLLGARGGTVAGVYCLIAICLVVVAVVFGAMFSMAFNVYFINLCGQLFRTFSANFVSHFRPVVPLSVLAALAVFTVFLFFRVNRKIKDATVAQEVRHE